jgi:hypothetical protein
MKNRKRKSRAFPETWKARGARGIEAEIPQDLHGAGRDFAKQNRCAPMQPGKSEELERKARFLALCAKNAQKFQIGVKL